MQIFNSLNVALTQGSQKSVQTLYKKIADDDEKIIISFLPVQKQSGTYNYGLLAKAFGVEVLDGRSPIDTVFDVQNMRTHLIQCLKSKNLAPFLKCKV